MIAKPLCIIPARGGSKRFPRKNMALLAGKPLLAYAVESARLSSVFDLVCVSSEDQEILSAARALGADLALGRPPELATDTAQVRHVCQHVLGHLSGQGKQYEAFAVLLTTNPLRTPQDVRSAVRLLEPGTVNGVMSLVPFSHPPQRAVSISDGFVKPYFGLNQMKPAQQLDPLYRHDGSIIVSRTAEFLRTGEFYGDKIAPYVIPADRSVDIDSPLDLQWAEFLLTREGALRNPGLRSE